MLNEGKAIFGLSGAYHDGVFLFFLRRQDRQEGSCQSQEEKKIQSLFVFCECLSMELECHILTNIGALSFYLGACGFTYAMVGPFNWECLLVGCRALGCGFFAFFECGTLLIFGVVVGF